MFSRSDFWIGMAVGVVAGVFGYRYMQEREQQMLALAGGEPAGQVPLAELERQKEELEDMIAAQKAQENKFSKERRLPFVGQSLLLFAGSFL